MKAALPLVGVMALTLVLSLVLGATFMDEAYRFLTVALAVLTEIDWFAAFVLRDAARRHPDLAILHLQYQRSVVVAAATTMACGIAAYHSLGFYAPPFSVGLGALVALSTLSIPSLAWLWVYFTNGFTKD